MPGRTKFQTFLLTLVIFAGLIPLFYFVTIEIGIAQAADDFSSEEILSDDSLDRFVENVAFGVNEKLSFDINYGFVNAGMATMEVVALIEYESRPCYQIITKAKSNKFFSKVFSTKVSMEKHD